MATMIWVNIGSGDGLLPDVLYEVMGIAMNLFIKMCVVTVL